MTGGIDVELIGDNSSKRFSYIRLDTMTRRFHDNAFKTTDQELFRQISEDDTAAFKILFERYRTPLYEVALKLAKATDLAEEIVQDVFIRLWVVRAQLPDIAEPENFIFRILLNKITDFLRKENTRNRILRLAALNYISASTNDTEAVIDQNESSRRLAEGIERLPQQQKKVYQLNQQEGFSLEETALHLGISVTTVKTHLAKAREFLRSYMKDVAVITILLSAWK